MSTIRKAARGDLDAVCRIYNQIHTAEERGEAAIGWQRGVYPERETAEAALTRGVKVTGVTVHFANADYDKGPIVAQRAITVAENDTLDTLEAKIHDVEHVLYPEVIGLIAEGRVAVDPSTNKVHIS